MNDLISRQAAIDAVGARIKWFNGNAIEDRCKRDAFIQVIDEILTEIPSADRTTGKWVKSHFEEYCGTDENHDAVFRNVLCVKCDQCGEKRRNKERFCPNCGTKMEVQDE